MSFCFPRDNPWAWFDDDHVSQFVGKTQILTCHVGGSPSPIVKWLKDGEEIKHDDFNGTIAIRDNRQYGMFGNNTHEVLLDSVELKHDGIYTCEVRNRYFVRRRNISVLASCKLLKFNCNQ